MYHRHEKKGPCLSKKKHVKVVQSEKTPCVLLPLASSSSLLYQMALKEVVTAQSWSKGHEEAWGQSQDTSKGQTQKVDLL